MLKDEKEFNLDKVIRDAENNGVKIINNISTKEEEFDNILEVANKYKNVFATIGVHPEEVKGNIVNIDLLRNYVKKNKVIAVGESGLEYHYDFNDRIKQKKSFEIHIEIARQEKLPLVIHSREADEDMIEILKSEMKNGEFKFLLHCFSSGKKLCWTGLDLNGYISLSGIITFKNAEELRNIIKDVPLNRILLETDSPFLAPVPFRGKINQPAYIKNIADYLVDFLKNNFNIIRQESTSNFISLFDKVIL
jgi:TatD DNase family protein